MQRELLARTEFELSMARSGSPPQPTVDELAAPQRRTPFVPAQPPPHMLLVSTAQDPSATQGSNAQPPVGRPVVKSISAPATVSAVSSDGGATQPPT